MSPEIDHYFVEIEAAFGYRRGKHLLLSPLDWALMEQWKENGIPLHVALAGIDEIFDGLRKQNKPTNRVNSLSYCKQAVEIRFQTWLSGNIGSHDAESEPDPLADADAMEEILLNLVNVLEQWSPQIIEDFEQSIAILRALAVQYRLDHDLERIERNINDINAKLRASEPDAPQLSLYI